ncbi:DUF3850 domain-containing protein [Candidatus Campbellbacteria bacterium]|nr:MAG: DUF3850 domain-containing protein [Candidatus Campbellbacteria bacterium]
MICVLRKKIWPKYFDEVASGRKSFELRLNDFEINEGDTLVLREWNPETKEYTGRTIEKQVGFVGNWTLNDLTKFWPKKTIEEKGLKIISLKD